MANKSNKISPTAIDLFCGCGGLSQGFEAAVYDILVGIDIWEDALKTYRHNHRNKTTICGDLSLLECAEIEKVIGTPNVDVVIGGPPCQGFSVAGKRIVEDKRNELYKSFVRVVAHFKPKAFVLENVPNILSIGDGIVRDSIVHDFETIGYNVVYQVLTASDYGVPQNRRRAVFVGLRKEYFGFDMPTVAKRVTCSEALSDLPDKTLSDGAPYPVAPQNDFQRQIRGNSQGVYNHEAIVHNADTGHRHHSHYAYKRIPTVRGFVA